VLTVHNDAEGRIVSIETTHPERVRETVALVRYQYDAAGNLVKSYDALGHAMSYQYDNHLMTRQTYKNGLSFYYEYQVEDGKANVTIPGATGAFTTTS
jgi:YD repeat-containing protein